MRSNLTLTIVAAALISGAPFAVGAPTARSIDFADLIRIGAEEQPTGQSEQQIELYGFMLPADREGALVYEFMLFAYPGACSHVAPPPPNQVVRVIPDEPFPADRMYQSVRVTGALRTEHNKAQLFVLDGVRIVESGFRISSATVEDIEIAPSVAPRSARSPWRFLRD